MRTVNKKNDEDEEEEEDDKQKIFLSFFAKAKNAVVKYCFESTNEKIDRINVDKINADISSKLKG